MSMQQGQAVVGDNGGFRRPKLRERPLLLLLAGILLIAIVAGGILMYTSRQNPEVVSPAESKGLADKAETLGYQKDYAKAFAGYDSAIAAAGTTDEKVELYVTKTNLALNAKDYDVAIDAGTKLVALRQTPTYFGMLAQAYEGKGDKAKALEYYKKAAAYFKEYNPNRNSNAGSSEYDAKIRELSGGAQ